MKVGDEITGYLFGKKTDPRRAKIVAIFPPEPEGLPYTVERPGFYFIVREEQETPDKMVWFHEGGDKITDAAPGIVALARPLDYWEW